MGLNMREQLADVDEIFEETWLKVIDSLPKYRDDGKFSAWLFRIARNKYFDRFRSASRKGEVALSDEIVNVTIDESLADPGTELNRQDLQGIISEAMADLSPEQREVFMLRQDDISFKEISVIQQCSLNTVLSRMQYAVKKLRRMLEEAGLGKKTW